MPKPNTMPRLLTLFLVAGALLLLLVAAPEALAQPGAEGAAESAAASDTAPAEAGTNWIAFLGRMHMVVLHLPIGLLLGALVIELLGIFRRSKGYDMAAGWLLVLGTVAAIVAVVFGLFLEEVEGTGSLTEQWHKWLGIAVAGLAVLAVIGKIAANRKQWHTDEKGSGGGGLVLARLSLLGAAVLLPVVGHLGGNMVHGNEFLFEYSPVDVPPRVVHFPNDPPVAVEVAEGTLEARWVSEVQPILDAHCIKCHGASKQNVGLRLDTLDYALQGFDEGPAIVLGSAEQSRLYQVVTLPPGHEYFMPPAERDSKKGLDLEEMRTVARWLADSADLGNEPAGGAADGGTDEPAAPTGPAYDTAAFDRINALGGRAQVVSAGSDMLVVSFANHRGPIPAEALSALDALNLMVVHLDFSNSGVTDADLDLLPNMPALERLYLKDTAITDAGLDNLPELFSITYLNLFGTQVTDAGLGVLEDLVTLDQVYLSETQVTLEGVQGLREALGGDVEVVYDDTVGLLETPDAGAAGDDAQPTVMVNTICPVSGSAAADPAHTLVYAGRLIGFCCDDCKAGFAADPAPFLANLP